MYPYVKLWLGESLVYSLLKHSSSPSAGESNQVRVYNWVIWTSLPCLWLFSFVSLNIKEHVVRLQGKKKNYSFLIII